MPEFVQIIQDRYVHRMRLMEFLSRKFMAGTYSVEVISAYQLLHQRMLKV